MVVNENAVTDRGVTSDRVGKTHVDAPIGEIARLVELRQIEAAIQHRREGVFGKKRMPGDLLRCQPDANASVSGFLVRRVGCDWPIGIFGAGGGQRLATEFNVEVIGRVPLEPKVAFGGESGMPVVEAAPDSEVGRAFFAIAATAAMGASMRSATGPKRSSLLRTVE